MAYVGRYFSQPVQLIVPVEASNISSGQQQVTLAVVDTGAIISYIDPILALDDLDLIPVGRRGQIYRPGVRVPDDVQESLQFVRLQVTIQFENRTGEITKPTEAVLQDPIDQRNPQIRLILGMNFLNSLDMAYFAGPSGAFFGLFDTQ